MRVTIDLDSTDLGKLHECIYDGCLWLGSYPEVRIGNTKGFHVLWYGCSEELMWWFRYLWDDWKRVRADLSGPLRLKQVLFSSKVIKKNGKIIKRGESVKWKANK